MRAILVEEEGEEEKGNCLRVLFWEIQIWEIWEGGFMESQKMWKLSVSRNSMKLRLQKK